MCLTLKSKNLLEQENDLSTSWGILACLWMDGYYSDDIKCVINYIGLFRSQLKCRAWGRVK